MKKNMEIKLVCNGELINSHSDGGRHYGWNNPIDVIPPIGSNIEYLSFNQNHKEGQGILTKYVVKGYTFSTEEDFNNSYRNIICKIEVEVVS